MQLQGRVAKVLSTRSGVSANSGEKWAVQEFLFEYFENPSDIYPRRCLLTVRGEEKIREMGLQENDTLNVRIALSVREYEGKYYNEIRTGLIEIVKRADGRTAPAPATPPTNAPATEKPQTASQTNSPATVEAKVGDEDDLPF